MAFRDFHFPDVRRQLGLELDEADLHSKTESLSLEPAFLQRLRDDIPMALAIGSEKARSEFIIAPMLAELRRILCGKFGLFSGIEFNVDSSRGLNGYCDFLFTRSPIQSVVTAPVMAIAEAKNDNLRNGYGQCIAAMSAAWEFNRQAGEKESPIHGVVTTGSAWKFLRLTGRQVTLDTAEYYIDDPSKIMAILANVLKNG